jgi:hypothetical protein
MKRVKLVRSVVAAALVLGPSVALACGELRFSAGKGLPFQTYLAPRPADVLILSSAMATEDYSRGLEKAGHRVTVVPDVNAMQAALMDGHFDVVIAAYDSADAVSNSVANQAGGLTQLLPIVARSARNSVAVRERFEQFVVDGASVGQYLMTINRLLSSVR